MKFFIDTANVEDIKKANDMGVICGVTTNPSLIAKEGIVFEKVIAEIASIVDGPISGEVRATTTDAESMIREGREIAKTIRTWSLDPDDCGGTQSSESSFIRRDQDECDPDLYGKPGTACGKSRGILCIPIPWKTG